MGFGEEKSLPIENEHLLNHPPPFLGSILIFTGVTSFKIFNVWNVKRQGGLGNGFKMILTDLNMRKDSKVRSWVVRIEFNKSPSQQPRFDGATKAIANSSAKEANFKLRLYLPFEIYSIGWCNGISWYPTFPRPMNQNIRAVSGAHVPGSFDEFGDLIAAVYQVLVKVPTCETLKTCNSQGLGSLRRRFACWVRFTSLKKGTKRWAAPELCLHLNYAWKFARCISRRLPFRECMVVVLLRSNC